MKSICGSDCCEACPRKTDCGGCQETGGHPFGGVCVAAKRIQDSGFDAYQALKQSLIREIQALGIPGLAVKDLCLLNGFYVNLAYPLPNGETVKLLTSISEIRLKSRAATAVMGWVLMKNTFWCPNMAPTVQIQRFFAIEKDDDAPVERRMIQ